MAYRLDIRRLFDDFGGPTQVAYILTKMGVPVSYAAARKWIQREGAGFDAIYLANLVAHWSLEHGPLDLTRYLTPVSEGDLVRPRASMAGRPGVPRSRPRRGEPC